MIASRDTTEIEPNSTETARRVRQQSLVGRLRQYGEAAIASVVTERQRRERKNRKAVCVSATAERQRALGEEAHRRAAEGLTGRWQKDSQMGGVGTGQSWKQAQHVIVAKRCERRQWWVNCLY